MRIHLAMTIIWCGLASTLASGAEATRLDLSLFETRWQSLPSEIQRVHVAPDGRIWSQCAQIVQPSYASGPSRAIRFPDPNVEIAAEFSQKFPQLYRAQPALFEPGGAVWFYVPRKLTRYDGANWVVYETPDEHHEFRGRCSTQGRLIDADCNRFAGDAAWFVGRLGVYRYHNSQWSYEKMGTDVDQSNPLRLAVSTSGKLAVASPSLGNKFWIFRRGNWSSHSYPVANLIPKVLHLAISEEGDIWMVFAGGKIRRLTIGDDGQIADETPDELSSVAVGNARVAAVHGLYQDARGRMFVAADSIRQGDERPAPGILIRDVKGQVRLLRGAAIIAGWKPDSHNPPPILTPSGEQAWLTGRGAIRPPMLLDFARAELVDEFPEREHGYLHAVDTKGRVYASRSTVGEVAFGHAIKVYWPGANESSTLAATHKEFRKARWISVGSDGAVWTISDDDCLTRWDGEQWREMTPKFYVNYDSKRLVGRDGVMLFITSTSSVLFHGAKELGRGGLLEILEQQRELIARAFGPGSFLEPNAAPVRLTADAAGRLWLANQGGLWILDGNRWHDATEPLFQAGARLSDIRCLAALGTGKRIYIGDGKRPYEGGRAFLGQFKDGSLVFENSIHSSEEAEDLVHPLNDRDGRLWTSGRIIDALRPNSIIGQVAVALEEDGVPYRLENSGLARFVDQRGTVWLGDIYGTSASRFNLWNNGRIGQQIDIRGYVRGGLIFSDKPGSVYVYAANGLQHLVVEEPLKQYRVAQVYHLDNAAVRGQQMMYSKLGYVAILSPPQMAQMKTILSLYKLPHTAD